MELCVKFVLTFLLLVYRVDSHNFKFAFNIYRAISEETPSQNVVVSPLSVETALVLLVMGAQGNTNTEILRGLGYQANEIIPLINHFQKLSQNYQIGNALVLANKIYVEQGYQFNSQYLEFAQTVFNTETGTINFADSASATSEINYWVSRRTAGKIQNLVHSNQFGPDTRMALVNALYFKDLWKQPFNVKATKKRPFWVGGTHSSMTDTMFSHMEIEYGDIPELDAQVARIPYQTPGWSMMIILPNKRKGLYDLEDKLGAYNISSIASKLSPRMVDVSLPKFKFDSTIDLKHILRKLGIEELFSKNANLVDILLTTERQTVDTAIHKASVEVDETGTVAAASTGIGIIALSASPIFMANHPFIFVILGPETIPLIGSIRKV